MFVDVSCIAYDTPSRPAIASRVSIYQRNIASRLSYEGASSLVDRPNVWPCEYQVTELSIQCANHLIATNWLN